MNLREEKGKAIAATGLVRPSKTNNLVYEVPSQTERGFYRVDLTAEQPKCTCEDFALRQKSCKHIYAAAYVFVQKNNPDGSVTTTEILTIKKERTSYPQDWKSYNKGSDHRGR